VWNIRLTFLVVANVRDWKDMIWAHTTRVDALYRELFS
jgi:hypothetical protein